ncbi:MULTISPECIES: hypothetical protein [unclassified Rhizobium]|uniref:hypothetical protein n=1 Tax=unclassified Rhizobium TaxID=2613769 RepID=UPI0006F49BD0|nr:MULTISPECIES: hypothetical protein [unclassified Rhizobium]KQV40557.1 hypothetical protein ASC86_21830 [Rhizobium sp. Root1212]KRD35602.1 hypothetical protein ASE37_21120 [Rhizobium sp. Root268]
MMMVWGIVEPLRPPVVPNVEIVACQSDMTGMVDAAVFPISRCGQRNARRAPNPSAVISTTCRGSLIDPPTKQLGEQERKVELDQAADYTVQMLHEEAHLIGWQRVEFLNSMMDSVDARLSALGEEVVSDGSEPGLP